MPRYQANLLVVCSQGYDASMNLLHIKEISEEPKASFLVNDLQMAGQARTLFLRTGLTLSSDVGTTSEGAFMKLSPLLSEDKHGHTRSCPIMCESCEVDVSANIPAYRRTNSSQ